MGAEGDKGAGWTTMKIDPEIFQELGVRDPERDMAIIFDYEIEKGMSKDEVLDIYESFEKIIESNFPSRSIWNYLSREHFLLYLDHYGREEILNMTRPLVQHT